MSSVSIHGYGDDLTIDGVRIGDLSPAEHEAIELAKGGQNYSPLEDVVVSSVQDSSTLICRKPDPEGILQCLEILATEPGETVYVGDSVIDVEASQAAGVRSISMLTGAGDSTSLSSAGTHRVLGGLASLPGLFI